MTKFKVQAESITDLYIIIEAESEEQAYSIARDTDGADFIEEGFSEWKIGAVIPMGDQND